MEPRANLGLSAPGPVLLLVHQTNAQQLDEILHCLGLCLHPYMKSRGGLPRQPSGSDSELPLQGPRVQSLIRELTSHVPHGTAKKNFFKGNK